MPQYLTARLILLSCLAADLAAQGIEGRPVVHELRIAPGAHVDLDTGVVLRDHERHPFHADLAFDRDGRGFFVAPLHGAVRGRHEDEHAPTDVPIDEWPAASHRVPIGEREPVAWFVKTDRGAVARATLSVVDPHSTASAALRWALAPASHPVFAAGPTDLEWRWRPGRTLELTWSGDARRYQVELVGPDRTRTSIVHGPRTRIGNLSKDAVHAILVRQLLGDGVVSLPSTVTVLGSQRPARRGAVDYGDRWYRDVGGIDLQSGLQASDAADVVFYLYGVYVPGGGVQRVGRGFDDFAALEELPERGYLPVYGRLDDRDVLAVRLADGRHAKIMLEPMAGSDLRRGMRAHYAFLEGGGRRFVSRPERGGFALQRGNLVLTWSPVEGAKSYRVHRAGSTEDPITTRKPTTTVRAVTANRLHTYEVRAIAEGDDESDPLRIEAHSYSDAYRVGRVELDTGGQQGYDFAGDALVEHPRGGPLDAALDLMITRSAGGASSLRFLAPYGAAATNGAPFGRFPLGEPRGGFVATIDTDASEPESGVFWVKTSAGGIASVRIRSRGHPRTVLDYVLRLGAR